MTDALEIVEKTIKYTDYLRIDSDQFRHRLHNGAWSDVMQQEIFEHNHIIVDLSCNPTADSIMLIDRLQSRWGAL
jgi:ADP-ribose pyrophosphatase